MHETTTRKVRRRAFRADRYVLDRSDATREWMKERSASRHAGHLLPELKRGQRVLDCGCGPGSITRDLARVVAPGTVVGLDIDWKQVAHAAGSTDGTATSVSFHAGDVYALPFSDQAFDHVFAHALLMHLAEPERALAEMLRVTRKGGCLAVSDPDFGASLIAASDADILRLDALFRQVMMHNGATLSAAHNIRAMMSRVGCVRTRAAAYVESYGDEIEMQTPARIFGLYLHSDQFRSSALHAGLADAAELDRLDSALKAWPRDPAAFYALTFCAGIGWR